LQNVRRTRSVSSRMGVLNFSWAVLGKTDILLSTNPVSELPISYEFANLTSGVTGSSLSSYTRIKTLAYDTILVNARFFDNDISAVPRMALTVGVATVLESREVVVVVTGQRKSLALSKAIGSQPYFFSF
jgi:hypothetical protein